MSESPCIFLLPLLHAPLDNAAPFCPPATALRLWPGLPDMPSQGYWTAADYPFSASAAEDCVRQMESLSEAALSGVPMQTLASMEMAPEVQKARKEWQDVAKFGCSGLPPSTAVDSKKVLQAAQKALLWAWLLEEKVLEIKGIMGNYTNNAAHLMDALGVEADDADTGLDFVASLDRVLDNSTPMLPPWAMVLENAALFLPDAAIIAVNSEGMAADLRDRLAFSPATAEQNALWQAPDCVTGPSGPSGPSGMTGAAGPSACTSAQCSAPCMWESATSPLWQALGKSAQCAEQPWRLKTLTFMLCGVQA